MTATITIDFLTDAQNSNGRVYPKAVLEQAIAEYQRGCRPRTVDATDTLTGGIAPIRMEGQLVGAVAAVKLNRRGQVEVEAIMPGMEMCHIRQPIKASMSLVGTQIAGVFLNQEAKTEQVRPEEEI